MCSVQKNHLYINIGTHCLLDDKNYLSIEQYREHACKQKQPFFMVLLPEQQNFFLPTLALYL